MVRRPRRGDRRSPTGAASLTPALLRRAQAAELQLGPSQAAALAAVGEVLTGPADGVYLHGPAGRGKTWLLDAVTACSPVPALRLHWTELFDRLDREVGRRLHAPDRLPRSLDAVLGDARLLCFDELEVDDPDDAGLVEHLLLRLQARGTRAVVTSNQPPTGLLPDPQRHAWARGLIARIEDRFVVCDVDDGRDHRRAGGGGRFARGLLLPCGAAPTGLPTAGLLSGGRPLPVGRAGEELWADFAELLGSATGRSDYLVLCRAAGTVGLRDVPELGRAGAEARRRFVVLVDVAHDLDTRLLLELAGPADWSALPPRTASRLALLSPG